MTQNSEIVLGFFIFSDQFFLTSSSSNFFVDPFEPL
jgi:hypothetical protein